METDENGRRFYYSYSTKGKKTKVYCQYDSRKGLEDAIMDRRTSLIRAIEIYMEEVILGKKSLTFPPDGQMQMGCNLKKLAQLPSVILLPFFENVTAYDGLFCVRQLIWFLCVCLRKVHCPFWQSSITLG